MQKKSASHFCNTIQLQHWKTLILGGTTNISNSMVIITITISMYLSKVMGVAIIMVAIAIEISIIK